MSAERVQPGTGRSPAWLLPCVPDPQHRLLVTHTCMSWLHDRSRVPSECFTTSFSFSWMCGFCSLLLLHCRDDKLGWKTARRRLSEPIDCFLTGPAGCSFQERGPSLAARMCCRETNVWQAKLLERTEHSDSGRIFSASHTQPV